VCWEEGGAASLRSSSVGGDAGESVVHALRHAEVASVRGPISADQRGAVTAGVQGRVGGEAAALEGVGGGGGVRAGAGDGVGVVVGRGWREGATAARGGALKHRGRRSPRSRRSGRLQRAGRGGGLHQSSPRL